MVTAYNAERYLAFLYTTGGVASLIQIICTAIVWLHWRVVLNTCAGNFQSYTSYYDERDCGCILYGRDTLSYFVGSHVGYCYWATFGLVIPLIFSFIFGCYHVYRVCCRSNKPRQGKMHVHQRSTEVIQLTVEQEMAQVDDVSPYFWTPAMIIGIIIAIYSLVHAILMLDGFLSTCKQYRNRVLKHINAIGRAVGVIQSRLSCGAIFDFMDYIQDDLSLERRRDYRINTAIPFILAVIAAWIVFISWVGIVVINIIRFRQSRQLRI